MLGKIKEYYNAYIKEDYVPVGVSVTAINAIESLRKLNIADISTDLWIHHEAHSFTNCLAIINIVITVKVENKWSICENCRHSNLKGS